MTDSAVERKALADSLELLSFELLEKGLESGARLVARMVEEPQSLIQAQKSRGVGQGE